MPAPPPYLHVIHSDARMASPNADLGPAVGRRDMPEHPVRRACAGRPWDVLAPWWLGEDRTTRRLADRAAARGLGLSIAATLVLERGLALDELADADLHLVGVLNARAAQARPTEALRGAAATYLRQLAGAGAAARPESPGGPVSLPARLTSRIASMPDRVVLVHLGGDLDRAIAWERAAVLAQQTIAEWAAWQALRELAR